MTLLVRSLALLSGLRIQRCHKLWCRSQTWVQSRVAVAVGRLAATAPIRPLAREPPHAMEVALEKAKRQKKKCIEALLCDRHRASKREVQDDD